MQASGSTGPRPSDRECLESWARHRDAVSLQTLVERYLVFVHSSALLSRCQSSLLKLESVLQAKLADISNSFQISHRPTDVNGSAGAHPITVLEVLRV